MSVLMRRLWRFRRISTPYQMHSPPERQSNVLSMLTGYGESHHPGPAFSAAGGGPAGFGGLTSPQSVPPAQKNAAPAAPVPG